MREGVPLNRRGQRIDRGKVHEKFERYEDAMECYRQSVSGPAVSGTRRKWAWP